MGKLSQRMREVRSRGDLLLSDDGNRPASPATRAPISDDVGWAMSALPIPDVQRRPRDLLLFVAVIAVIIAMNAVFWGADSDRAAINPGTGRQVNQSEPWD